jgi:hypothetical protein
MSDSGTLGAVRDLSRKDRRCGHTLVGMTPQRSGSVPRQGPGPFPISRWSVLPPPGGGTKDHGDQGIRAHTFDGHERASRSIWRSPPPARECRRGKSEFIARQETQEGARPRKRSGSSRCGQPGVNPTDSRRVGATRPNPSCSDAPTRGRSGPQLARRPDLGRGGRMCPS